VERIIERCAGLDVHKSSVTACVRISEENEGLHQEIREFATTTRGLLLLRDWLASFEVRLVGMEATGVYWKPIYYMLEDDFELWLLNARHLKNVPGRKTDVKDAAWICQLVEHGLVRPSFVPPKEIRELRNLTRYRKAQIEERTREVQRLEKVLQDAGIKLSSVATRVLGASGRAVAQMRWSAEPPTRRSWRSWLGAAFAPNCPRSGMLWRDASPPIMPSWWAR
jgi:transposase